jgi:conjugal transfer pilus assembly protein TraW
MRIMHPNINSLLFIVLSSAIHLADATSLGTDGEVYPIVEPDLLQLIQANVAAQSQAFREWNQNNYERMDRQPRVEGLSRTQQSRVVLFDPTVTLPNIGVINPLDTVSLTQPLIFYDADDKQQVQWVQQIDQQLHGNAKLILVGGSVLSQMQLFHKKIYFDQEGKLTARFQLKHVPVLMTQEGKHLKIQEVALK